MFATYYSNNCNYECQLFNLHPHVFQNIHYKKIKIEEFVIKARNRFLEIETVRSIGVRSQHLTLIEGAEVQWSGRAEVLEFTVDGLQWTVFCSSVLLLHLAFTRNKIDI